MNPDEISKKLIEMDEKLSAVYESLRKIRAYFKWILIITVALFILPLIGLLFAIPSYLKTLNTITSF